MGHDGQGRLPGAGDPLLGFPGAGRQLAAMNGGWQGRYDGLYERQVVMSFRQKLQRELVSLVMVSLYFGAWIGMLVLVKQLVLTEYHIEFHGMLRALLGTLLLAKVVLVLEHVSLGNWVRSRPACMDVLQRTLLYGMGVFVVLVLEKAFEARVEYGGFVPALLDMFSHLDIPHVWVNSIVVMAALLIYNVLSVVRCYLPEGSVLRLLLQPLPEKD